MAILQIECAIFDPIKITTTTSVDRFIIDTWYERGLILRSLLEQLPGLKPNGHAPVILSSGMSVDRPLIKVGVQIRHIRAVPVEFHVVDDGPAPLLFGSDFLSQLFNLGSNSAGVGLHPFASAEDGVTVEPPAKYRADSVGIRLIPSSDTVDSLQLEKFLGSVRAIHNIGVLTQTQLHQHADWPRGGSEAKRQAVRNTILEDNSLSDKDTLKITWVETGSIWVSLASGSQAALSWVSQIFEKSMNARLRSVMADVASVEEQVAINQLTRDDIARAKIWEQRRYTANNIRGAREEWRKDVLGEVDFRRKLTERIQDEVVRQEAQQQLDNALQELVESDFLPLVEHVPHISQRERDLLPVKHHES